MPDIKYEIVKNLGALSKATFGWTKELNLVSWNDRGPKYDLREQSEGQAKMSKGITLMREELLALRELLQSLDLSKGLILFTINWAGQSPSKDYRSTSSSNQYNIMV